MSNLFRFEKVSFEQFKEDMNKTFKKHNYDTLLDESVLRKTYENIRLPEAKTEKSAGFDFFIPFDLEMRPGTSIVVPTGIRWIVEKPTDPSVEIPFSDLILNGDIGLHLCIYPRSGLGFKYHVAIANTVGIIDEDYWESDNEGEIMIKIVYPLVQNTNVGVSLHPGNENGEPTMFMSVFEGLQDYRVFRLSQGTGFAQGIVTLYMKNQDFTLNNKRNGGLGSTTHEG